MRITHLEFVGRGRESRQHDDRSLGALVVVEPHSIGASVSFICIGCAGGTAVEGYIIIGGGTGFRGEVEPAVRKFAYGRGLVGGQHFHVLEALAERHSDGF